MKVLLVTGLIAKETVERYSKQSRKETTVVALPISVAAFMTPEFVAQELKKRDLSDVDMILLPGTVKEDVSLVEKATGIPTFKGPVYAADIPDVLDCLEQAVLSKTTPASDFLQDQLRGKLQREIESAELEALKSIKAQGAIFIGQGKSRIAVGPGFPMRIVAEIVDAPNLEDAQIARQATYFFDCGADIVDLGMIPGRAHPDEIKRIMEVVRSTVTCPISIDTFNSEEIRKSVSMDVDLVLSLDLGNLQELAPIVHDIPTVITPTDVSRGTYFTEPAQRVSVLEDCVRKARSLGAENLIADPVVDPPISPGLLNALEAYSIFSRRNPSLPLFFGAGNVTEMIDADSTGINCLLAALASEIGASLLFTPEYSTKARGSVAELAKASKMMFVAKLRQAVPKDLGVDLLILKDKRSKDELYDRSIEDNAKILQAEDRNCFEEDPKGWFKILLDRKEQSIILIHFPAIESTKPDLVLRGKTARALYLRAIDGGLLTQLEHAAYLGRELAKAETALSTGKSYVQDESLFSANTSRRN